MSEEEMALALPTPGGALVPKWWADVYGPRTLYVTSLDTMKPEERSRLLRAINEDPETVKSVLNLPIGIVGYTASPASREQDGEIQEWVRIVLHLDDGRDVSCGSMGILRSLLQTEQLMGRPPWKPALQRVIKARDLKDGKQWFYLAEAPPARKPDKKGAVQS